MLVSFAVENDETNTDDDGLSTVIDGSAIDHDLDMTISKITGQEPLHQEIKRIASGGNVLSL